MPHTGGSESATLILIKNSIYVSTPCNSSLPELVKNKQKFALSIKIRLWLTSKRRVRISSNKPYDIGDNLAKKPGWRQVKMDKEKV